MDTLEEREFCFPHLHNTSCQRPQRPLRETMLIYILLSVISFLTVALNLLVIISITHFKQLHTPTNFLLLSLAVADFVVGLVMPFQILITEGCWILSDVMCTLVCIIDYITTSASVGTIMLISIDRYVAICYPLHYSTKITVREVTIGNCLCWAFSALYNGVIMNDNLTHPGKYNSCFGECVVVISYHAGIADIILTFICPVTVIVVLYARVFVVAVSQAHAMRSHIATVTLSETVPAKKSELKAAKTLGVLVIVFLTCLCPYFCSSLVSQETLFSVTSVPLETWLFYLNSCLNPLIYAFCYPWFRKSIKVILTCKIFNTMSSEINVQ
ncbi:trace amine-associated receptor 13c-like [Nelusetta ayraudi]|uniref:trace amine-associated receptor 13c-like n=1 Tax=Nelusetta ayraudi TaxID=303726 RepID=UPI003F7211AE